MFSSSNQAIFDPGYIFLLLIILGIVYLVYFAINCSYYKIKRSNYKYFNYIFHYLFDCWILYGGNRLLYG